MPFNLKRLKVKNNKNSKKTSKKVLTRIKHPDILKKLSLERAAEPEQENNIETLSRCTFVQTQ